MVRKNREDEEDWRPPSQSTKRHRSRTWSAKQTPRLRRVLLTNKNKKQEAKAVVIADDDLNAPYYNDFREHVINVRAYLQGKWTENLDADEPVEEADHSDEEEDAPSDREDDGEGDSLPRNPFFDPHWTDAEKDAFFHALAIHSRLRPDLIAASIKTKTILDVSLLMRSLEDAIDLLKAQELESDFSSDDEQDEQDEEDDSDADQDELDSEDSSRGEDDSDPKPSTSTSPAPSTSTSPSSSQLTSERKLKPKRKPNPNSPRKFESDASKKARRDAKLEASYLARRAAAPRAHGMSTAWLEQEDTLSKQMCRLEDGDTRQQALLSLARLRADGRITATAAAAGGGANIATLKKDIKGKGRARDNPREDSAGSKAVKNKTSNLYFVDSQLQLLECVLRDAEDARAAAELAAAAEETSQQSKSRSLATATTTGTTTAISPQPPPRTASPSPSVAPNEKKMGKGKQKEPGQGQDSERDEESQSTSRKHQDADGDVDMNMNMDDVERDLLLLRPQGSTSTSTSARLNVTSRPSRPPSSQRSSSQAAAAAVAGMTRLPSRSQSQSRSRSSRPVRAAVAVATAARPAATSSQAKEEEKDDDKTVCAKVRRRFLNRVYMRKQRALKSGGKDAVEAVDTKTVRLKSGRKSKAEREMLDAEREEKRKQVRVGVKRKRVEGDEDDDSEEEDEEEEEEEGEDEQEEEEEDREMSDDENADERGKRVKGLKSKAASVRYQAEFEEAGINNAALLEREGIGYFNLAMLGKFVNYFASGYRDRTIQGTPAISASLIRVLYTTVVEFLVDVIRRTIVLGEARSTAHSKSKVFRDNRIVSLDSVKMALEIAGRPLEDRKVFLSRLMQEEDAPSRLRPQVIQTPVATASLAGMSFHDALHPPLYQLPRDYGYAPEDEEALDDVRQRKRRRSGYLDAAQNWRILRGAGENAMDLDGSIHVGGGGVHVDLVSEEEDPDLVALDDDPALYLRGTAAEEKEFRRQMEEEEELDALDVKEEMDYEQEIWDRILAG